MAEVSRRAMREWAVSAAFGPPAGLGEVLVSLGFVQADPIRAPARAQDLILRQRVAGYRAGDLERHYPSLGLDEAHLHVYGFMPERLADLLLPRAGAPRVAGLHKRVLGFVHERGEVHPRELDAVFGRVQAGNAWGGVSAAGTQALDDLAHHGHLRIARRVDGIRVYAPRRKAEPASPEQRIGTLVMLLVRLLAPVPAATISALEAGICRMLVGRRIAATTALLKSGDIERGEVEGVAYLWPAGSAPGAGGKRVRILAPFDPLVWDRRRLEHLWEWRYRFEAYTPPAKRVMGYYAMPMLYGSELVGWVNANVKDGRLVWQAGYRGKAPPAAAVEAEIGRLARFLGATL